MNKARDSVALIIVIFFCVLGFYVAGVEQPVTSKELKSEIHFLDVGQGDAILLESGSEQTLIDGGPDGSIVEALSKVMLAHDRTIDNLILTHPHADHLRGLIYVLEGYEVEKVYFNGVSHNTPEFQRFMQIISEKRIISERLYIGKNVTNDNFQLKTLWPPKDMRGVKELNDSSLVFDLSHQSSHVLLTGDVSSEIQEEILGKIAEVDILKVSHHGSKTGTTQTIINQVRPQFAIITVGRNSYGHPAPSVLNMLAGAKILRTDRLGTISFWFNNGDAILY